MIYDCFPFFNELDLLEIRLHELDPVVDRFVLIEATRTFQKQPKPLFYADNRERFARFHDKIVHVVVDRYPNFFAKFRLPTAWDYDNHQKNQVARGLVDCRPNDTIIISDLDEIPAAAKVAAYRDTAGIRVFEQRLSNFFFNCVATQCPDETHLALRQGEVYWRGSVMLSYRELRSFQQARLLRNRRDDGVVTILQGGWHFSFMGGWEMVRTKLDAWAHTRERFYNPQSLSDPARLQAMIEQGKDLFGRDYHYQFQPVDERLPAHVVDNPDRFQRYLRPPQGLSLPIMGVPPGNSIRQGIGPISAA